MDVEKVAAKSQVVMEEFLDILGWQISRDEKKRLTPLSQFAVLGVVVDLKRSCEGLVKSSSRISLVGWKNSAIPSDKLRSPMSSHQPCPLECKAD